MADDHVPTRDVAYFDGEGNLLEHDLVVWLRFQIDEDERQANRRYVMRPDAPQVSSRHRSDGVEVSVLGGPWRLMTEAEYIEAFMQPNPDQRLLREVEAKRQILDKIVPAVDKLDEQLAEAWGGAVDGTAYDLVRLLGLPYSDRPGYLEKWRPPS